MQDLETKNRPQLFNVWLPKNGSAANKNDTHRVLNVRWGRRQAYLQICDIMWNDSDIPFAIMLGCIWNTTTISNIDMRSGLHNKQPWAAVHVGMHWKKHEEHLDLDDYRYSTDSLPRHQGAGLPSWESHCMMSTLRGHQENQWTTCHRDIRLHGCRAQSYMKWATNEKECYWQEPE